MEWVKYDKSILSEISKVSGLSWQSEVIPCWVNGRGRGFSSPLTLRVMKTPANFIDSLIHELLHQIWSSETGNGKKSKKAWAYIYKRYKNESKVTQIHIPVHAISKYIYLKVFDKQRLERDIERCQKSPAYKRSWEIVERDGYENIIREFRERIIK